MFEYIFVAIPAIFMNNILDNNKQIPKKITPDRIKDSVIEIRYVPKLPFEVLIGIFFNALDESYIYSVKPRVHSLSMDANSALFYNEFIKLQLLPNSFVFNCMDKYIGWDIYKEEINKVFRQIYSDKYIHQFTRIGVRYVSEYEGMDLRSCVNFDFTFGMPDIVSSSYSFQSEFYYNGMKAILNLHNNIRILKEKTEGNSPFSSLIDIDVINENFNEISIDNLMDKIEVTHLRQKEIFFTVLRDEFLKTLNPEY